MISTPGTILCLFCGFWLTLALLTVYDVMYTSDRTNRGFSTMFTAIYMRVSSNRQEMRSQESDLTAYKTAAEARGEEVRTFRDKRSGTNFNRPEWQRLWAAVQSGQVQRIVVWRLDRLGRLAGATIQLLDELESKGVSFLSIRDGFDPSTLAGRLTRNVLASVAQFETEVRSERQRAGIEARRDPETGKCPWGGRQTGIPNKGTMEKVGVVRDLHEQGRTIAEIGRIVGLTRQTVYRLLSHVAA
jgi:DNA invertase Pin-like site-specific DNA recombinase